jgi:D-sedoheptulose 7-phosphate isomerase
MFIGNGGSAAISSHMAIDFNKNGRVRALAFNDGAALTCLGNDHDFSEVFSRQIGFHAQAGDLLFAISSSGRSADIVKAVAAARDIGCQIVTLSGFTPDNPLRLLGDINLFVPSDAYGFVEISHLVLCHAVVDQLTAGHLAEIALATEGAF